MAKIRLRTFKGKLEDGTDVEISTLKYIIMGLTTGPKEKGLTLEEILKRARVDRILEAIKLEDQDFTISGENLTTLQEAMREVKWTGRNPIITDLIVDLFEVQEEAEAPVNTKSKRVVKLVKD